MSLVVKSLNAATAIGPGLSASPDTPKSLASAQIVVTGSPDSFSVSIEITVDGTNWKSLGTLGGETIFPVTGTVFTHIRANLISLSGGTLPTITVTIAIAD